MRLGRPTSLAIASGTRTTSRDALACLRRGAGATVGTGRTLIGSRGVARRAARGIGGAGPVTSGAGAGAIARATYRRLRPATPVQGAVVARDARPVAGSTRERMTN